MHCFTIIILLIFLFINFQKKHFGTTVINLDTDNEQLIQIINNKDNQTELDWMEAIYIFFVERRDTTIINYPYIRPPFHLMSLEMITEFGDELVQHYISGNNLSYDQLTYIQNLPNTFPISSQRVATRRRKRIACGRGNRQPKQSV